ncbi:putative phenazine biosynthesis-like protein [Thozetella sp. PMI_491]|nr:putative phenazine biosynthesis-like protein [Thozetella sp. PMI_491]
MAVSLQFATVNVFTRQAFTGNPLAIVIVPEHAGPGSLTRRQKLLVAREFNMSETIFIRARKDLAPEYEVEIFTPATELPFAGHPVIGAGFWLLQSPGCKGSEVVLLTKAGRIPVSVTTSDAGSLAEVRAGVAHDARLHQAQFPSSELQRLYPALDEFLPELAHFPIFSIVNGMTQVHVELPSLSALAAVQTARGGEIVPGDGKYLDDGWSSHHLVFYFFVQGIQDEELGREVIRTRAIIGQLEDPATGSAACGLAAYLALGTQDAGHRGLKIVQGVELGRRSEIGVDTILDDGGKLDKIYLRGAAVEFSKGHILVPT